MVNRSEGADMTPVVQKLPWQNVTLLVALMTAIPLPALGQPFPNVVCNFTAYAIPNNVDGIYINFVTGAVGTSGSDVPGWDFNPFSSSQALQFFWTGLGETVNAGVYSTAYMVLPTGVVVGPASTFSSISTAASAALWGATISNEWMGVRFTNEATGLVNYGGVRMSTTAPTGFPATITAVCYNSAGDSIGLGWTPVSLQSFSVD